MAKPVSSATQSYIDYSKEGSRVTFHVANITPANQAAQVAAIGNLFAAILGTTLGRESAEAITLSKTFISRTPPVSKLAQREKKWLFRYHDINQTIFRIEVPCADLTYLATNTDSFDTALAPWTTLKTAFEAVVVSPDDGSACILDSGEFVGREL